MKSRRFNNFAKAGAGRHFFDSKFYRFVRSSKNYLLTYFLSYNDPELFRYVKTYCTFIGHMKSGGSMLSAMLDAHPNAVFADEANALSHLQIGFKRDQLFHILLRNSRAEAAKGRVTARRLGGYSWKVPGQWQGKYDVIHVMGDSTTGASTRSLSLDSNLIWNLHDVMAAVNVKFIHVIRNPFDPIAASMVRGKRTFESASENYFSSCDLLEDLRKRLDAASLLPVRYEDFVKDPQTKLSEVCRFLGLDTTDDYLNACVSLIHQSDDSRNMVEWKREWIDSVHAQIEKYDFLQGYTYGA